MKNILSILCTASAILLWGCGEDSSTSPISQTAVSSSAEEASSSSSKDNAVSSSSKELSKTSSSSAKPTSSSLVSSSSSETTSSHSEQSSSQSSSSSSPFTPCSEAPTPKENWKYLNPNIQYGCFKDSRDNQYYATVKIGDYTWMAENLGYKASQYASTKDSWYGYTSKGFQSQNQRGYLYTWDIAMTDTSCQQGYLCRPQSQARGICPEGFHIPSYWEWQNLFNAVGGESIAARDLKSAEVWADSAKGTDKYGFSVIPNGPKYGADVFNPVDHNAVFWSSNEMGTESIATIQFQNLDKVFPLSMGNKEFAFSIRCLMDYPEQEAPHSGIPHDPDKIYQCDEMLMDDINTWHFKNNHQEEYQYFIDDTDSISVHIKDSHSEFTNKTSAGNNEEDLYSMFWAAMFYCKQQF